MHGEDLPAKAELVAQLADARINESSGLALGRRNPGIFWTLNDSGGGSFIFAVNQRGHTAARFEITDAINFDWEDLACGPMADGRPAIFIGDIGDNFTCRAEIVIYQLDEPAVEADTTETSERKLAPVATLRASYPDGCHNAESLLCHPTTGRLYIITKRDDGQCGVYAFPEKLTAGTRMMLERVAGFQLPQIARSGKRPIDNCMSTGAAFAPDGSRIVVSTYSSLYQWPLSPGQTLAAAFAAKPQRIVPPLARQMEAVCYGSDGRCIWFTSEKAPAPLYKITPPVR